MQVILPNRATARLHRGLIAAAGALLLAVSVPATARPAPESFAELSEKVVPAVVNISTTQPLKRAERQDATQPAPGSPEELFKDFFDKHRPEITPGRAISLGPGRRAARRVGKGGGRTV